MRYLKTYEEQKENLTPEDFRTTKYWRYGTSKFSIIMKLTKYDENQSWNQQFTFLAYSLIDGKFTNLHSISTDMIWAIIRLEDPEKILRPATEEEIKEFEFEEQINKYNL